MTTEEPRLPAGTVTFLFTDVEGSTRLLHELGAGEYAQALAEHRRVLRAAFAAHGGVEVDTQGDAFFVAFPTAPGTLEAVADAMEGLVAGPIRVRMGIHTGTPYLADEGYVGVDVHRAARIAACGHGGQVLVSASTAALVGTDGLRDLGEHRLKDLAAPERIYQLGDDEFPPLKSLHQTNLPIPATPFLGRARELADVLGLLSRNDVRLLTLTGPGGTGKTRLVLQAAAEAFEEYRDGIFWVPLAALRDPKLVLETAGQVLGAKNGLTDHIADKSMLLVFDNFEHLVEGADGLSELLGSCPNVRLLVTSRELLRVPGEQAYAVPPLEPEDGRELFLARARAADPAFAESEAVAELCARLDNLPLALELAAARVRVLSPEKLLERLSHRLDLLKAGRGVDPRQQTLRATIEWSHELLDAGERRLFARLAVFRGGCTLETAEDVCDADIDTLQSLVDKSLVRVRDSDRFWMLETILEFATERLEQSGEAEEVRRRHAEHFVALAEEAEPTLLGGNPGEWLDRLERDHDNLRSALDWLASSGGTQLALRLGGAVWEFWCLRGHHAEGWRRLEDTLRSDDRATAARAKALTGAAHLARGAGAGAATARQRAEEALALHGEFGDAWWIAYAEYQLAGAISDDGDLAKAQELFERSVRRLREVGDEHHTLQATRALAFSYGMLGDLERCKALHEENLNHARTVGNELMEARSLGSLGALAGDEGRLADALSLLKDAYRIDTEIGHRVEIALDLARFGQALAVAGRSVAAAQVLSSSEALREETGVTYPSWGTAMLEENVARVRAQLDEAAFAGAWEQGRTLTAEAAVALALTFS